MKRDTGMRIVDRMRQRADAAEDRRLRRLAGEVGDKLMHGASFKSLESEYEGLVFKKVPWGTARIFGRVSKT